MDDIVQRALEKRLGVAGFRLIARWCTLQNCIVFGCRDCVDALAAKTLVMPPRYKNPGKSRSFAHFNVTSVDIVRAILDHPRSKIHKRAVGLSEDTDQQLPTTDPLRDELLANHLYIAVSSLVKLKPAQHFIDGLSDSLEVGGSLDHAKWGSRAFYDQVL